MQSAIGIIVSADVKALLTKCPLKISSVTPERRIVSFRQRGKVGEVTGLCSYLSERLLYVVGRYLPPLLC